MLHLGQGWTFLYYFTYKAGNGQEYYEIKVFSNKGFAVFSKNIYL